MDTSETYIKMCEKAEEIRELWKPQGGDYHLHNYRGTTGFGREQEKQIWGDADSKWQRIEILCYKPMEDKNWFVSTAEGKSHITSAADMVRDGCIWLPRQDQLQEMLGEIIPDIHIRKKLDGKWYITWMQFGQWEILCDSMEQLWIALVMKEKYNKTWNGEDWQ